MNAELIDRELTLSRLIAMGAPLWVVDIINNIPTYKAKVVTDSYKVPDSVFENIGNNITRLDIEDSIRGYFEHRTADFVLGNRDYMKITETHDKARREHRYDMCMYFVRPPEEDEK